MQGAVLTPAAVDDSMARNKTMGIRHCFDGGNVVYHLESSEKFAALHELIHKAPVFTGIRDREAFEESVISREKLQSTGFGHGVAVAHGRSNDLTSVLIGLGLSRDGIPYESPDEEPVRLLFLIASPKKTNLDYLQALSTLVRVIRDCSLREILLSALDAEEIEKTIRSAFAFSLERIACSSAT
jgi:PTS system nitrogen regulatory IIA component